jgi:nucleotide-binding universal stress UspA family protein
MRPQGDLRLWEASASERKISPMTQRQERLMTTRNRARRIVVGVDGSPESLAALGWAVDEAGRTGGEIDAVLAYDSGLAWIDVGSEYQAPILEQSATRAKAALHHALEGLGTEGSTSVSVRPLVVEGHPARVLVEVARDAELLVVGSRGRGGFAGVMLGSVSQRCAGHSACPVVVVPSPPATTSEEGVR